MSDAQTQVAERCLAAAYEGTMDFSTIVGALIEAGFESYTVDYRLNRATYYVASGASIELAIPEERASVAAEFQAQVVERAVREAQAKAPGYTYAGFGRAVRAAGCAGYTVSFLGRRVVYFGRTAETHVEHFPS